MYVFSEILIIKFCYMIQLVLPEYNTINWRDTTHFYSEDDYRTGCRNVSHCQQQQSYSGLRSPGRSNSTYFWNDSWVQTFHSFNIIWERWISPMTTYDLICISQMHPHRMKRNRPLHFRVPNRLTFKIRPSAQPFLWKWVLFGWALNLVLIPRPGGTRKWPIIKLVSRVYSFMLHLLSWQ